jgi:hypothetical protein
VVIPLGQHFQILSLILLDAQHTLLQMRIELPHNRKMFHDLGQHYQPIANFHVFGGFQTDGEDLERRSATDGRLVSPPRPWYNKPS